MQDVAGPDAAVLLHGAVPGCEVSAKTQEHEKVIKTEEGSMREILFRGERLDNGERVEGEYADIENRSVDH